jgi:hypothetical protein
VEAKSSYDKWEDREKQNALREDSLSPLLDESFAAAFAALAALAFYV